MWLTWPRAALALTGTSATVLSVVVLVDRPVRTVGPDSAGRWGLVVAVGLGLVAAGVSSHSTPDAVLLTALGALWLVPELEGVTGIAAWAAPLSAATVSLLVVLVLLVIENRATTHRGWARGAVLLAIGAVVTRLFLVDPFTSSWCWRSCAPNPLALSTSGETLQAALLTTSAVAGTVVVVLGRLRWTSRLGAAGIVALVVGLTAPIVLRTVVPTGPSSVVSRSAWALALTCAALLATDTGRPAIRAALASFRLTRLAGSLTRSPGPEELGSVIGRAVGDQTLRIRYWDQRRERFLDAAGRPARTPPPGASRRTLVTRAGRLVAAIDHARGVEPASLDRALGPALRLVLENAALRSSALAELEEARATRSLVVETGTAERRRLERDLHDGAQQRVVALALLTRMLADTAQGPPEAAAVRAVATTKAALEELRRVARGLYPAILSDSGMTGALEDLADSSLDVVVELEVEPVRVMGPAEQEAAYRVCSAALVDARDGGAGNLRVVVRRADDRLVVTTEDDGGYREPSRAMEMADQVAAVSGVLRRERTDRGARLRLELPCGS